MGRDIFSSKFFLSRAYFNPLSPHGERLYKEREAHSEESFQSTLPAWGETVYVMPQARIISNFNPLSPHGERLRQSCIKIQLPQNFNPLSPHGERLSPNPVVSPPASFQSTLPAWGETRDRVCRLLWRRHFNPLSPHGERPDEAALAKYGRKISIHSPRMGRDIPSFWRSPAFDISIHSPRMGRDTGALRGPILWAISIHSPRMGRDARVMPPS